MNPIRSKHRVVLGTIALVFLSGLNVVADATLEKNERSASPTREAKAFLADWLIQRDVDSAMRHVSEAPILGTCARPPALLGKSSPTPKEFRAGIKSIFQRLNELTSSKHDLAEIIEQTGTIPSSEKNFAQDEPFELFSLKKEFRSSRFLCKFDNNRVFRRAFSDPDVWYLTFKLRSPESSDMSWILAWRKEGKHWRIFSLSPIED